MLLMQTRYMGLKADAPLRIRHRSSAADDNGIDGAEDGEDNTWTDAEATATVHGRDSVYDD